MKIIKTYYLIDYENVGSEGFKGCGKLREADIIHLFYTDNSRKIDLDIINDLTEQYGAGAVDTAYTGLVIVKLVDFDQDSQPELFCAYMDSKHYAEQRVYTYTEDGAQLLLTFQTGFSNYCSPLTTLLEKDGLYYIKVKDGAQDMYYGMTDGEFVQTDYIQYGVNTWNGESMENSAFRERLDSYETVYSVDFERIDNGDGPSVLSDTESTIQSLQDAVQ